MVTDLIKARHHHPKYIQYKLGGGHDARLAKERRLYNKHIKNQPVFFLPQGVGAPPPIKGLTVVQWVNRSCAMTVLRERGKTGAVCFIEVPHHIKSTLRVPFGLEPLMQWRDGVKRKRQRGSITKGRVTKLIESIKLHQT